MTVRVSDLPAKSQDTAATRLKQARLAKNLSRRALAELTGIPEKSIEKYEQGTMEPNLSRLQVLSEKLEVSAEAIMTGPLEASDPDDTGVAGTRSPVQADRQPSTDEPVDDFEAAQATLTALDGLRADGYDGNTRRALALIDQAAGYLRSLEPAELVTLADACGVHRSNTPDPSDIAALYAESFEQAEKLCEEVASRIVDTAFFGTDLYTVDFDMLKKWANDLDIDGPFFGWDGHADLVPALRSPLRQAFVTGRIADFTEEGPAPGGGLFRRARQRQRQ